MLNFQKIYEWFFNSFRMNGGTHLIRIFEQEHVKHLMIIRRSWIYGILINLLFIPIVAATVVNISFILMDFASNPVIGSLSIGIIAFGALLLIYSGSVHIFRFHKVRGGTNDILDIYEWERRLSQGNSVFSEFFNQITLSYFLSVIVTVFEIYRLLFVPGNQTGLTAYLHIVLLCTQVLLISYYRRRIIDLEMDYILVIPGKIYFMDQVWVHTNIQTVQLMSNIKFIQSSYPHFLASFFNFGTIEIILDYRQGKVTDTSLTLHMHYITDPIETVNNINKLLVDYENTPLIIDTILKEIGLNGRDFNESEITKRVGTYLTEHEDRMKNLFLHGTPQEKNEIVRIYKRYMPHHSGF